MDNEQKIGSETVKHMRERYLYPELDVFAQHALAIAESKHQHVTRNTIMSALMLVVTELSEAANEIRDGRDEGFAQELAGAFVMMGHIAAALGVDLSMRVQSEMIRNQGRPSFHGHALSIGKNLVDCDGGGGGDI